MLLKIIKLNKKPPKYKTNNPITIAIPKAQIELIKKIPRQSLQAFLKLKEHLAQTYAKLFQLIKFQGYEIPVVNCPSNFASRVGEILAEQYPFALMYCLSTTKVYCSLRSNTKSEVDVSAIAKVFKGGGHFHAAGFGLIPEQLPILFKGEL